MFARKFLRRLSATLFLFWKRRGYWSRALVCYLIGLIVMNAADHESFDFRYLARGNQPLESPIAVITISQNEAARFAKRPSLLPVTEVTDFTDSFYWDAQSWRVLLQELLKNDVRAIGVTLFFGQGIGSIELSEEEREVFSDPRVVWSASITSEKRLLPPRFANPYGSNVGVGDVIRSTDRVVRHFPIRNADTNHLTLATIQASNLNIENAGYLLFRQTQAINYRGTSGHFPTYSLSQLLSGEVPYQIFRDKIVYIGASDSSGHAFYTPLGSMNRAEIFANISENILRNQWIDTAPFSIYAAFMFFMLFPSVWLVMSYPQGVSFFIFIWIGTLMTAMSTWLFDQFYFWVPALAPSAQLAAVWVVFVGYQGTLAERRNWVLQHEQDMLKEFEQLKNNFVSLISHDLKTPIAKIQAMVDQLSAMGIKPEAHQKLDIIRSSSDELHRYIKTIINILRVESRQVKLKRDATDVNELVENSMTQLAPLAAAKSISLTDQLEPMFSVELDPTLIQEVINNLIENGIKYTPEGGKITVTSQENDDFVVIEVSDTGVGIPEDELEKVWQKFARGSDQEHKSKGSGLGLYLVKYFIELHGGEVFIKSQVGVGTNIGFRLPVNPA